MLLFQGNYTLFVMGEVVADEFAEQRQKANGGGFIAGRDEMLNGIEGIEHKVGTELRWMKCGHNIRWEISVRPLPSILSRNTF